MAALITPEASDQVVEVVYCDLHNLDEVKSVFDKALEVLPRKEIDVLVNCAGIQRRSPAVDFSENDWDDVSSDVISICPCLCHVPP
jgi:2-deoxy-D-gluconate 3-dehydrogenase